MKGLVSLAFLVLGSIAASGQDRLFSSSANLPENKRIQIIQLLNVRLAEVTDLKTQAKFAHWNVKGMSFMQLHELFDSVAEHLEAHTDLIAERITALGGRANGTVRQVAEASSLPEYDTQAVSGQDHAHALAARLGTWSASLRSAIASADKVGDIVTSGLLTEIALEAEKDLWFVEAHLQQ
jgi:starvation-inducible DNA-binding protein